MISTGTLRKLQGILILFILSSPINIITSPSFENPKSITTSSVNKYARFYSLSVSSNICLCVYIFDWIYFWIFTRITRLWSLASIARPWRQQHRWWWFDGSVTRGGWCDGRLVINDVCAFSVSEFLEAVWRGYCYSRWVFHIFEKSTTMQFESLQYVQYNAIY